MSHVATSANCPRCAGHLGNGRFCATCNVLNSYPAAGAYKASRWRRLGGALLEPLLMVLTLGIGWLIWLYFTAPDGQTPAKKLLNMYILKDTGEPVSAGKVWLRDVFVEIILFGAIGSVVGGIVSLVDAVWILLDKDHQTLHDKIVGTIVVHVPSPVGQPPTAQAVGAESNLGQINQDSLRATAPSSASPGSREDKLRELQRLADQGLITPDEHAERRRKILDDI